MNNWQEGKLQRASLIISLPLALLSIASIVVPPAVTFLRGDYARLEVTLVNSDFNSLLLLVTNTGNKAAVITGVELDASDSSYTDVSLFPVPESNRVVEAGRQVLLSNSNGSLISASVQEFAGATDLPQKKCKAVVEYSQFDSKKERTEHEFRCFAVDHEAATKIANLDKSGVTIPWKVRITANGAFVVPDRAVFEWAHAQPGSNNKVSDAAE